MLQIYSIHGGNCRHMYTQQIGMKYIFTKVLQLIYSIIAVLTKDNVELFY